MTLVRVITATTGPASAQKIVRREEESGQARAPVDSVSAASVRKYSFALQKNKCKQNPIFLVSKTCGGVTNMNGTFFQSPGYPSTFDRSQIFTFYATLLIQIQFTVSAVSSDFRDWIYDPIYTFLQTPTKYKIGSVNS